MRYLNLLLTKHEFRTLSTTPLQTRPEESDKEKHFASRFFLTSMLHSTGINIPWNSIRHRNRSIQPRKAQQKTFAERQTPSQTTPTPQPIPESAVFLFYLITTVAKAQEKNFLQCHGG
ncbi:hypothetical protein CDAR_307591 [Caerostris darwini]|uniref:Uncharacterized protein n=1 Tax=Caerostris darwini TaxID=1538125 RepID=A0AAV4VFD2_9ARAC|nr:hypothetical protein CDAR_307591 [Caerostris darwini]